MGVAVTLFFSPTASLTVDGSTVMPVSAMTSSSLSQLVMPVNESISIIYKNILFTIYKIYKIYFLVLTGFKTCQGVRFNPKRAGVCSGFKDFS
jgi:hypothetical protein